MKENPCVITTFNSIGNDWSHCQLLEMHKNMKFSSKYSEHLAFKLYASTNFHDILLKITVYGHRNSLGTTCNAIKQM